MQQKTFTFITAIIAFALLVPAGYALWKINRDGNILLSKNTPVITMLNAGAFGDLSSANASGVADGKGDPRITEKAMNESLPSEPISYEETVYIYTYAGDLSTYLQDATGTVYERQTFSPLPGSALENLSSYFSGVNMNKFSTGELSSFVLQANGYMFSIDALGNMWSIYRDWTSYTLSEEWTPMTAEHLPSDEAIFSAAENFVNTWGVDVSAYGSPVINESEIALARTGAANIYVPESATVIYPVLIEGNMVYPAWTGAPSGLRITVNLRDLTVTSAYDTLSTTYHASTYNLTQDTDLIKKLVAGGGTGPVLYEGITINEVIIHLNNPERTLMEYSLYDQGRYQTLFVPALRFTMEDPSLIPWTNEAVMVPLVQDIAQSQSTIHANTYFMGDTPVITK